MATHSIQKQVDDYLPLLSPRQQVLVLEMIKGFLNIDNEAQRISKEQYNRELDEAVARIENGHFISHEDALKELSKW